MLTIAEKGKYSQAIDLRTQALEINPDDVTSYWIRALCYSRQGDYDRAIADYTKVIELKPNNADAYNNRGIVYQNLGDDNKAIADYNKALAISPNNWIPESNLKSCLIKKETAEAANEILPPPISSPPI